MISENEFDVLVSFDQGWAKIFVTLDHQEILLIADVIKCDSLVWKEITSTLLTVHQVFDVRLELSKAPRQLFREGKEMLGRSPTQTDVHSRVELIFGVVIGLVSKLSCHEGFDFKIVDEPGQGHHLVMAPCYVESWVGNELQTQSKK